MDRSCLEVAIAFFNHKRGPVVEANNYYPFGLTMTGISSKALAFGVGENKYKFTGQLLDDELGWDTYQFRFRTMDPQIGRFLQIDPLSDKYVHNSTYTYAENRVTIRIDLEGLELFQTTNIEPGKITKTWDINVKVVNNDPANTDAQVNQRISEMKSVIEKTFSGKDAKGISVNTNFNPVYSCDADYSNDFILSLVPDLPGHQAISVNGFNFSELPDAAGNTSNPGNLTFNVFSVVNTDVIKNANGYNDAEAP